MTTYTKLSLATPPKFISFEGTEGVGKTTAITNLCQRLTESGIDYVCTREPGGSEFAERLREILLDPATDIVDDTELLLMFAARTDHIAKVIKPALDAGKWVICDRFTDSTIAYQGFGRCQGLDTTAHQVMLAKISMLIEQFVSIKPTKTLWLDLPVLEGIERAGKRSVADRFEQQKTMFFQRVYKGYQHIALTEPKRFIQLDASGSTEEVIERVWQQFFD